MSGRRVNLESQRQWEGTIREAVRSCMSICEFRRRHNLTEKRFYWWHRRLYKDLGESRRGPVSERSQPSFFWSAINRKPCMSTSNWCSETGVGCASAKASTQRNRGLCSQLWKRKDVELSSGDKGLPLYHTMRHAAIFRWAIDDGGEYRLVHPSASVLQPPHLKISYCFFQFTMS